MLWQSLTWFTLPEGFALNIREWYRMITNDVALETPLSLVRLKVFLNLGTNADGKICHSLATPCANMMVNSERTSSIDYCNYSHLHLWHFMCLFMLFIYTYIYIYIYLWLFMLVWFLLILPISSHSKIWSSHSSSAIWLTSGLVSDLKTITWEHRENSSWWIFQCLKCGYLKRVPILGLCLNNVPKLTKCYH